MEVISPNDSAAKLGEKIRDFLAAGVPLLWVVYPESPLVHVFRKDGNGSWLKPGDVLDGEDVCPASAPRSPTCSKFERPGRDHPYSQGTPRRNALDRPCVRHPVAWRGIYQPIFPTSARGGRIRPRLPRPVSMPMTPSDTIEVRWTRSRGGASSPAG